MVNLFQLDLPDLFIISKFVNNELIENMKRIKKILKMKFLFKLKYLKTKICIFSQSIISSEIKKIIDKFSLKLQGLSTINTILI